MALAAAGGMTGITNRPEGEEQHRQEIVEEHKQELLPAQQRGEKDEIPGKAQASSLESRDRVVETGAGRGTDHQKST